MSDKPFGVALLAVIHGLFGLGLIGLTMFFLLLGVALGSSSHSTGFLGMVGVLGLMSFLPLLLGFFYLFVGYGLWNTTKWAWWIAVILSIIGILSDLFSSLALGYINISLWMVMSAIVVFYLWYVREEFDIG